MTENEKFDQTVATKVAQAERVKRVLIVITTALVSVSLVMQFQSQQNTSDAVDEIRKTQTEGSPVIKALTAQADRIEVAVNAATALNEAVLPCFDPDSQCSKDAAAEEAARAGAYNAAVIAAHFCTDQVLGDTYTLHQLTRCVGDIINESR